jgi:ATP-dependent protease ClpP protease subunit
MKTTKEEVRHVPEKNFNNICSADPARTVEWLGAVNYNNLEQVLARVKEMMINDGSAPIHLLVNSFGGTTGVGMSFYDAMRSWLRPELVTIGSGDVDSSGIIVLLAGVKRYVTKNTTLLLHLSGRTFSEPKRFSSADLDSMVKEDKLKDYQYACALADASDGRHTTEKILELMSRNTLLTSEEAVNMGFAHAVIG